MIPTPPARMKKIVKPTTSAVMDVKYLWEDPVERCQNKTVGVRIMVFQTMLDIAKQSMEDDVPDWHWDAFVFPKVTDVLEQIMSATEHFLPAVRQHALNLTIELAAERKTRMKMHAINYERRIAEAKKNSDTWAYYYVEFEGSGLDAYKDIYMPAGHVSYFFKDLDPAVKEQFRLWMKRSTANHDKFTDAQFAAIDNYAMHGYKQIWAAYESGPDAVQALPCARDMDSAFRSSFVEDLPVGTLLFEGQGKYESDIFDMLRYNSKWDQPIVRRRPSSTSWVPAAAMHFLGIQKTVDVERLHPVIGIWHKHNEKWRRYDIQEHADLTDRYSTVGVFLVLRIAAPGVKGFLRQTMLDQTCDFRNEAEVTLMPGLKLTPVRAPELVELPMRGEYRVGMYNGICKPKIYWVDVVPAAN
jgi:hypothetical protein